MRRSLDRLCFGFIGLQGIAYFFLYIMRYQGGRAGYFLGGMGWDGMGRSEVNLTGTLEK